MLSSAYLGNDPEAVTQFESWIGKDVDFVRAHTGRANWSDYVTSVGWVGERMAETGRPIVWTIPMFADGGNLAEAARGGYSTYWRDIAATVAKISSTQDEIIVRFGEEFNGSWMPWAAQGRETDFIGAFRGMVDAFRSVSDKFQFEFNVNIGGDMNPEAAYPGDEYVDIVSMDFYYNTQWDSTDPIEAWNYMVSRPWGLQWLEDFAASHEKSTAYSEWGVDHDGAGPYIEKAFEWFNAHETVYQSYWMSDADYSGALDGGERPNAARAYIEQMLATSTVPDPTEELAAIYRGEQPPESGAIENWIKGTRADDHILGTARNDYLNGGVGRDVTEGGLGDDTYVVASRKDVVIEKANAGIDLLQSWSRHFVLPDHVENMELLKASGISGKGNALDNAITGGMGDDTINGAGGDDWLTGGGGGDEFRFDRDSGRDTITDFDAEADMLKFVGLGIKSFDDVRAAAVDLGPSMAISLGAADSVLLEGVQLADLTEANFIFW